MSKLSAGLELALSGILSENTTEQKVKLTAQRGGSGKGREGFEAHIYFKIDGGKHNGRTVKVSTYKANKGVGSVAQVMDVDFDGDRQFKKETFMIFSDPSLRLGTDASARCTEKNVLALHKQAIDLLHQKVSEGWID